ncbi:MAG TPA: NPCBM/NEW2 domain-containing protein [Pyrinomonadaceae bacterium]
MRRTHKLHTFVNRLLALSLTALLISGVVLAARAQSLQSPLPRPRTCAAPATGMLAWWPGDGNAQDIKGGNDGILDEGAGYSIGKVGAAFDFNGQTGFMSAGVRGLPVGNAPRTVETWVYTTADSWGHNRHTIFEYGESGFRRAFGIDMENYPEIEVYTFNDDLYVDTHAPLEGWLHVAATYENETLNVYVNGVLRGSKPYPGGIDTAPSKVAIGKSPAALNGATYLGRIDEVSIYDRALTPEEVGSIYSAGDAGKCRYSVSGRITDTCGVPLQDATVTVQSGKLTRSTTTDADGNYLFRRLPGGGDYVITPQVPADQRGDFAPPFSAFASLSADQTADFFFRPFRRAVMCTPPFDYVSDLEWVGTPINAYQEVHRDASVGDGQGHVNPITLNGVVYPKGLGVHANSEVIYNLSERYSSFIADVGVDDEVTADGSVVFLVIADGTVIYNSGPMFSDSATQTINVNVVGVRELRLKVTDAENGDRSDHADWANARLVR